jgi:hypothetical protein
MTSSSHPKAQTHLTFQSAPSPPLDSARVVKNVLTSTAIYAPPATEIAFIHSGQKRETNTQKHARKSRNIWTL